MNNNDKYIIFIGLYILYMLLLGNIFVFGYVPIEDHNGIKIKWYGENMDKEKCLEKLDMIPERYKEGIFMIRFFDYKDGVFFNTNILGIYYYFNQMIDSLDNCNLDTLIHELAHHKNKMDRETHFISNKHGEVFFDAYKEINQSVNG